MELISLNLNLRRFQKKYYYIKKIPNKLPNHNLNAFRGPKDEKKREYNKEGNNINTNITNRNIENNIELKDEFGQKYSRKRFLKSMRTRRQIKEIFQL